MAKRRPEYFRCPHCDGKVRIGAAACPHCGSDNDTGWSEDADVDAHYGEDDDFDYDDFVASEFPDREAPFQRVRGVNRFWQAIAIILILIFAWSFLKG